ncbi:MAG: Sec-independent protein translocase TatB [Microbacterium sp.]|uniref:Sec-independent protein translocase TatB n=1 Tax=Microbacterium sp. TaxID=51671 RepID=UPI003A8A2DA5
MFNGITFEKLLLIGVLAALLIGPERLPRAAEGLARFVKRAKEYMRGAQSRLRDEMGDEFDEVDWRKLDPRQYDPRRIIREALLDDAPVTPAAAVAAPARAAAPMPTPVGRVVFSADDLPPYDAEAT